MRAEFVVFDDRANFRSKPFSLLAVNAHHGFRHGAEPSAIGRKSVDAYGFAPGRVVVPAVARSAALFDDDPCVDRKDSAPTHRPSRKYPHKRVGMLGRRR